MPLVRDSVLAVPGVYAYWGRKPEHTRLSVYVGQTGAVVFRMRDHWKRYEWLRFAMMVYSQESLLDQSLLRVLEVELVQKVWRASEREAVRCETRADKLPVTVERYLGSERAAHANQLVSGCCDIFAKLAVQVDMRDGILVTRCFDIH